MAASDGAGLRLHPGFAELPVGDDEGLLFAHEVHQARGAVGALGDRSTPPAERVIAESAVSMVRSLQPGRLEHAAHEEGAPLFADRRARRCAGCA